LAFPEAVVVVEAALWTFSGLGPTLVASAQAAVGPRSAKARRVIEFSGNSSESPGESLSRVALASHGLPAPQQQAWISDDAGTIGRVDFLWPAERTVGEFDGRSKYERVEDLWAEKRREDRLRSQGYEVVRWIWRDVVGDFGPTAHRIRSAFARAVDRSVSLPLTS